MQQRIVRLAVYPTNIIIGMMSAIVGLVVGMLGFVFMLLSFRSMGGADVPGFTPFSQMGPEGLGIMIMLPILYFTGATIATSLAIYVFNLVAPRFGGVPIELNDDIDTFTS